MLNTYISPESHKCVSTPRPGRLSNHPRLSSSDQNLSPRYLHKVPHSTMLSLALTAAQSQWYLCTSLFKVINGHKLFRTSPSPLACPKYNLKAGALII